MADLTTWTLVAETKEFVGPLTVVVDGASWGGAFDVQVRQKGSRPIDTDWEAALLLGSDYGVLVGEGTSFPLTAGFRYLVYVRITASPEVPVLEAGAIRAI